jgi:hypothetical protein
VITAFFELNHGIAFIAALPAFLFSLRDQPRNLRVFRTVGGLVHAAGAERAGFSLAFGTGSVFAAGGGVEVRGTDPDAAAGVGAVDSVFGVVFVEFLVVLHLEFEVEQILHVREWYMLIRVAATWRHVGWICDCHAEDSAEAGVAHSVTAF